MVQGRHGQRRQGRGLVEVGGQPGRALREGLWHLPRVVERVARRGGRCGAAKARTGAQREERTETRDHGAARGAPGRPRGEAPAPAFGLTGFANAGRATPGKRRPSPRLPSGALRSRSHREADAIGRSGPLCRASAGQTDVCTCKVTHYPSPEHFPETPPTARLAPPPPTGLRPQARAFGSPHSVLRLGGPPPVCSPSPDPHPAERLTPRRSFASRVDRGPEARSSCSSSTSSGLLVTAAGLLSPSGSSPRV